MDEINVTDMTRGWRYVERAKALGVDVTDPYAISTLLKCIRFCEIQFSGKYKNQDQVAEALGVNTLTLRGWLSNRYMDIASQVVTAEYFDDAARMDKRNTLFGLVDTAIPAVIRNLTRIATGQVIVDEGGKPAMGKDGKPMHAPIREQVAAAKVLLDSTVGQAYIATLLTGDSPTEGVDPHLIIRRALSQKAQILSLDDIIDVEPRQIAAPASPAP